MKLISDMGKCKPSTVKEFLNFGISDKKGTGSVSSSEAASTNGLFPVARRERTTIQRFISGLPHSARKSHSKIRLYYSGVLVSLLIELDRILMGKKNVCIVWEVWSKSVDAIHRWCENPKEDSHQIPERFFLADTHVQGRFLIRTVDDRQNRTEAIP